MTPEEFQAVASRIAANPSAVEIARRVLLEGQKQIEVARQQGVTRSCVSKIIARFVQARHQFETLTVTLPKERAEQVRVWHREALRELAGE